MIDRERIKDWLAILGAVGVLAFYVVMMARELIENNGRW